jgi:tetratricopeptide (TPR) repeat protein
MAHEAFMTSGQSFSESLNVWFWRQMATWSTLLKRDAMALEYWQRILAVRPSDASVMSTVAHLLAQRGRRDEAIGLLRRALELEAGSANGWFNLGFMLQEQGDHPEALSCFDRVLSLDEKHDRAHYGRGLSLVKLGQFQEAVAAFKKNVVLQPLSPYGFYQLAHVYHRLGQPDQVQRTIRQLAGFEPQVARQLQRETGVDAGLPPA